MSEEPNDSPAFRLRPRRAAPKSYYTVRLEYSANPQAFIRERPRAVAKKRSFTQKAGSYSTKYANATSIVQNPTIVTKEEREREEKRIRLHRETALSITTNTVISPFVQRLELEELEPDSSYEYNYINLRIVEVEQSSASRLIVCLCQDPNSNLGVEVHLFDEFAHESLVVPGKIMSIGKFKTSHATSRDPEHLGGSSGSETHSNIAHAVAQHNNGTSKSHQTTNETSDSARQTPNTSIKTERNDLTVSGESSPVQGDTSQDEKADEVVEKKEEEQEEEDDDDLRLLPFHVIVRYDELVERATSNSNRGFSKTPSSLSPTGGSSVNRRPLIPFVSITDMIEQPEEPFVEISPTCPVPE